jgi:DNA-binding transcriptional ArsR family regulator
MAHRILVAKALADFLGALSHPHRIRIVQELRDGERDVNALRAALGISHSGVSQHLAILRVNHLVAERREGRRVIYRLRQPGLARWLLQGFDFVQDAHKDVEELRDAVASFRAECGEMNGEE